MMAQGDGDATVLVCASTVTVTKALSFAAQRAQTLYRPHLHREYLAAL